MQQTLPVATLAYMERLGHSGTIGTHMTISRSEELMVIKIAPLFNVETQSSNEAQFYTHGVLKPLGAKT